MIPHFTTPYVQLQRLLVEARRVRSMTQAEVANLLGVPQSFVSKYERGERRLDVIELLQILRALDVEPYDFLSHVIDGNDSPDVLQLWKLSPSALTEIVNENPSLRGMMLGYVAEFKLKEMLVAEHGIGYIGKPDDHDRTRKGDHIIEYKGYRLVIESKSLQSRMVNKDGDVWRGKAQVDASDRRAVILEDGTSLATTLLVVGEFDVLAVNCFAFGQEWKFVFAKNDDLPRSTYRRYSPQVRNQLIASLVSVSLPAEPPFTDSLTKVLDEIIAEREMTDR